MNKQYKFDIGAGQEFLYFCELAAYTAVMNDLTYKVADWLRSARREAGYSQEELGARLARELGDDRGYTKANISAWENQKHNPNLKQLLATAKVTGTALPQDLLHAAQPASGGDARPVVHVSRVVADAAPDTVPVRRLNVKLHAGIHGADVEYDESFGDDFPIPAHVLTQLRIDPHKLRAFQIKGMSGEPMFFEDDIVIVDIGTLEPINRELFAVLFDGEPCVKQMLYRGGQWYLHSINPDFGPVNVRSGEVRIIGRVVYQPGRVVTGRL
jgi:phage repressor protein C with HTH and peptisase S24 domain